MEKQVFEYNSSLDRLIMPEYGRNMQRMVDHVKTLTDKEERNRAARTIIHIMGTLNPHLRDINDFKHKLWDHLAVMADFELDIDWPYSVLTPEVIAEKPKTVPYNHKRITYKHYGKTIELMLHKAVGFEGEERRVLVELIVGHMKKQHLNWTKEHMHDDQALKVVEQLTQGQIKASSITLTTPDIQQNIVHKQPLVKSPHTYPKTPGQINPNNNPNNKQRHRVRPPFPNNNPGNPNNNNPYGNPNQKNPNNFSRNNDLRRNRQPNPHV